MARNPIGRRHVIALLGGAAATWPLAARARHRETFVQRKADALGSGAFINSYREAIAALAVRHALPAMYAQREIALAGD